MQPVIEIENLGKRYWVSHLDSGGGAIRSRPAYESLRDVIAERARGMLRPPHRNGSNGARPPRREEFWAVRDVSFAVDQGDRIGVIGRNGAGKSTLLKLLSRITEPTRGRITLRGRIASLLEVGTGFHPELTGRENIFLNGAIMGMTRPEIQRKFDEIVAFAEVERFLDTPVKRYSSGMYVRLAFAVAAHLEPEVLIVDEVLAVGDAQFQKKCLGKMEQVGQDGRTVLFVSHNMAAVRQLCTSAILLNAGCVEASGRTEDVVARYLRAGSGTEATGLVAVTGGMYRQRSDKVSLETVELLDQAGRPAGILHFDEPFSVRIRLTVHQPFTAGRIGIAIQSSDGAWITNIHHTDGRPIDDLSDIPAGEHALTARFDNILTPGRYSIHIGGHEGIAAGGASFYVPDVLGFEVLAFTKDGVAAPVSNSSMINMKPCWSFA